MSDAPSNIFAGNPLDRAGDRRNDPAFLARMAAHPEALAMRCDAAGPVVEDGPEGPRLAWTPLDVSRPGTVGEAVFLGLWKDAPAFAVEAPDGGTPLREAAMALSPADAAMAGAAKSLFDWRRRHRFCSNCGAATDPAAGGWKRVCPSCAAEHFPRVDPVCIMLPVFQDRCFVARGPTWPAGRMSAPAGFIEPGETIEEACARELFEEAGLKVTRVRHHSSQPWPFPSQLMIGLVCAVENDAVTLDPAELAESAWLTRQEAADALAGRHPTVIAPPPVAIARTLIRAWVDGFEA
ncbi:MAG TPA: NAD(+) diphosphatase [Brevundimonas sp.]|jgi:NAD+ diphosphatase|uniref:NAD(+) diphosphatase n=1 Tax=Brevundimonas sp. TaxID=1871086 RepID=UPI002DEDF68F|nr:NAD(+) diphosphatase [Brevundimonas sp.]